jgi:hypothetical protein
MNGVITDIEMCYERRRNTFQYEELKENGNMGDLRADENITSRSICL